MTKEEILKLYMADLSNLLADSDAKRSRIMELEDELEQIKQGRTLPIDSVSKQRELFENMQYYMEYCQMKGYVTPQDWIEKHKHF